MSNPKYDFAKFPSKYPQTVKYSAKAHVRGRLHMHKLRLEKWNALGISPTIGQWLSERHGGTYSWTKEDQAKLVARALSETPFLETAPQEPTVECPTTSSGCVIRRIIGMMSPSK
jgi:hypothetical protein